MGANDFGKVAPGDPLRIPANAYNAMMDTVRAARGMDRAGGLLRWRHSELVTVRNASGFDQDRFNIMGVLGPIFTPGDNPTSLEEFCNYVGLAVGTPRLDGSDDDRGRFVILTAPLAAGDIGTAWASGVCPVRILGSGPERRAEIEMGDCTHMKRYVGGSAEILWLEPGIGSAEHAWAIIRFGQPAIPPGIIVMWSGTSPPGGWTICDGGNDSRGLATPDLRGRFIVGYKSADEDYGSVGNTGGVKEHALDETIEDFWYEGPLYAKAATEVDQTFDNRPPYYVLAYLRKD